MKQKVKKNYTEQLSPQIVAESRSPYGLRTYVSLFSSAGVGCYGFQLEGFHCVATVELVERRLAIQRHNNKCAYDSGYICGDMTQPETKDRLSAEMDLWRFGHGIADLDVLIATPPCQGMSVANHKKKDELRRNSLVVESIEMVQRLTPRFFVFENVRAFLTSICTDLDGQDKPIRQAIEQNLSGHYNIHAAVLNFKDYGCPSSRTRTLVIGVRKDIKEITPHDLMPDRQVERTLRDTIGDLPSLTIMGQSSADDIYHNFRSYAPHMTAWIEKISEGQSAFDNTEVCRIPHTVKNGVVVYNAQKNGDKYTRQRWDKVAPCIHTRNDIMASQNTVHPKDNRVFSVREVMRMMSVPDSFKWTDKTLDQLNALTPKEKQSYLKKEEMNIRQTLGEAVPTVIFQQVARKVRQSLCRPVLTEQHIAELVERNDLDCHERLVQFIQKSQCSFVELSKIAELANAMRCSTAAYYTRQDICHTIVEGLPQVRTASVRILEPSIGVGNFLPTIIRKYADTVQEVHIDVVDINAESLETLQELVKKINVPQNVTINYIHDDFLLHHFTERYDIVVGNPPYMKVTKDKQLLAAYKAEAQNKDTNNTAAFFLDKAMRIADFVSLILPKSIAAAPEFNATRRDVERHALRRIIDFGEKAFKGVKIETICLQIDTKARPTDTTVESYITEEVCNKPQTYITDQRFPCWLIYRDSLFDKVADNMEFNVFKAYRDRAITKTITKPQGKVRVLKSRNIGDNSIIDIPGYDSFIDDLTNLDVAKYIDLEGCVLLPNLTYNPRACFKPRGCIADGSVAILTPIDTNNVTERDLAFYATDQFSRFYAVARNRGTRSLNIDNNSVFFFGKLKTTTL